MLSKKGRNPNKRMSVGVLVCLCSLGALIGWLAVAALVGLLSQGKNFTFIIAIVNGLADYRVWVIFMCLIGGIAIMFVAREMRSGKRVLKINDIEDSRWLTKADIKNSDNMTRVLYKKLSDVYDGVPVYAKRRGNSIEVVLAKGMHTLTIGTTRTGKTTTFVDPTIQILCRTKTKPSMVITDPKGELFRRHAATLKKQGYNVLVIDMIDPYRSLRWSPFAAVIEKTRLIVEATNVEITETMVEQKNGRYIDVDGVVHDTFEHAYAANKKCGFNFEGKYYDTKENAETARKVYIQELTDEIFIDIQDVIYTCCPITSQQEPVWEQGARNFIFALALAMWEDLRDGVCEEQTFNLHTLYKNIAEYAKGDIAELSEYLTAGRDSRILGLANPILAAEDKQLSSYLSQVNNYMVGFADSGIRRFTSGNDIDVATFDEKPISLFIKIPDEKENRHFLVTLFVTQLYKMLVEKARQNFRLRTTKDEELKRTVYLIMDEFGNLPKFPSMRKILAVGASRKIYMMPIIQSYAQLDVIYGRDDAAIIRDNCNIKIFIGSNDNSTIKEFSELCGKTKQRHISFGDGMDTSHFNVNTSAESIPLIYPSELEKLNSPPDKMGNAIVLTLGNSPIRAKFEPVFAQRKQYGLIDDEPPGSPEPQVFNEDEHYYDFAARSLHIARSKEYADRQFEQAQRTVEELLNGDMAVPHDPSDPLDGADERLMPIMITVKNAVSPTIGLKLEKAFYDHDVDGIIDACVAAIDYSSLMNKRFICSEAVKLKRIIQQLAANVPLKID